MHITLDGNGSRMRGLDVVCSPRSAPRDQGGLESGGHGTEESKLVTTIVPGSRMKHTLVIGVERYWTPRMAVQFGLVNQVVGTIPDVIVKN